MDLSNEIDLTRFRELSDGNPGDFRELVELYLTKTAEQIADLGKALEGKSAKSISLMAHSLIGANLMVGLNDIVPPLRQLEAHAEKGDLTQAPAVFRDISSQFHRIEKALKQALTVPPP